MDFQEAVNNFAQACTDRHQEWCDKHMGEDYENKTVYRVKQGKRWTKILYCTNGSESGSVHSFIDTNGDVYKPASWQAPAKHVRGNIFKHNHADMLDDYGHLGWIR